MSEYVMVKSDIWNDPDLQKPSRMTVFQYAIQNCDWAGVIHIGRFSQTNLRAPQIKEAINFFVACNKATLSDDKRYVWMHDVTSYKLYQGKAGPKQYRSVQKAIARHHYENRFGPEWCNQFAQLYAMKHQITIPLPECDGRVCVRLDQNRIDQNRIDQSRVENCEPGVGSNQDNSDDCKDAEGSSERATSEIVKQVVDDLNLVTGRNFNYRTAQTAKAILARVKEGATLDDFKVVHRHQFACWGRPPKAGDKDMRPFLRPKTLYAPSNFEGYLQDARSNENGSGAVKYHADKFSGTSGEIDI
jgi:uncharacterized phage protein (TIGR02220 family)